MAQTIKLKRSAVAGRIPSISDLELGEVGINTYDGKMYIKKSVSGAESVVEIGGGASEGQGIFKQYSYTATLNQTTFSGTDSNGSTLSYTPNFIQVYLNGILLDPAVDFTATDGVSVVLTNALAADDLVQIDTFSQVIGTGDMALDTFTGTGSQTNFTLSDNPGSENNTLVYVDGVYQEKDTYAVAGLDLVFSTAPYLDASIEVIYGSRSISVNDINNLDVDGTITVTGGNSTQWNTAYGWGDHSTQNYATQTYVTTAIDGINSSHIEYDNTVSELASTNVKGALDELQQNKASVDLLSSTINLFPTTASSDIANHNRLVTDKLDSDYDTTAVDVPTGPISTSETLVGQLISDANLIEGSIAGITVTLIGNIEKTAGNQNRGAHFYFKMFRRESNGTEYEMGESGQTPVIYETDGYQQFSASLYINDGGISTFSTTDRLVIRFYGISVSGSPEYRFQFGGLLPIRALVPVPVSVIPSRSAEETPVDTTDFAGILGSSNTNVQSALDTLDDHNHDADYAPLTGYNNSNWDTAYGWGDHSTEGYATQSYVNTAIANLVDSSPESLNTLNELAAALNDDANFGTTVNNAIANNTTEIENAKAEAVAFAIALG